MSNSAWAVKLFCFSDVEVPSVGIYYTPNSGSTLIALGLGFLMLEGIRRRIRTSEA